MNAYHRTAQLKLNGDFIDCIDKTILITGANGFIGLKLVQALLEYGFTKLRCLVRSERNLIELKKIADLSSGKIEIINGNLLSKNDCSQAAENAAIIYHLAAGVEKSFPGCYLNSVISTRNLLDAVVKHKTLLRFVNISSIAVYSNNKTSHNGIIDETCEIDKKVYERWDPYTYGKAKQDEIVRFYAEKYSIPFVIIRPGAVFGPGKAQITSRVGIDLFGVFLHLGHQNLIPFTYVNNCAEAIALGGIKRRIEGHTFNIIDDDLPSSKEFIKLYKQNVKYFLTIPVWYPVWFYFCWVWEWYSQWSEGQLPPAYNRGKCRIYWKGNKYSNSKAKRMLGWYPRIKMKDALDRYFSYIRATI
jgi:nucleoside-diphosphate-sugar epimerase